MSYSSKTAFEAIDGMTGEQAFATALEDMDKAGQEKVSTTLLLDKDVADFYMAMGAEWQDAINDALRAQMKLQIK